MDYLLNKCYYLIIIILIIEITKYVKTTFSFEKQSFYKYFGLKCLRNSRNN